MRGHVKTLVLDLEDVLVHKEWSRAKGWQVMCTDKIGDEAGLTCVSQLAGEGGGHCGFLWGRDCQSVTAEVCEKVHLHTSLLSCLCPHPNSSSR